MLQFEALIFSSDEEEKAKFFSLNPSVGTTEYKKRTSLYQSAKKV